MTARIYDVLRGEDGSALVTMGILAVVLALLGGALLEIGQWYAHRRHIQVRTDAAALAAGQALASCFSYTSTANDGPAVTEIEDTAKQYDGIMAQSDGTYLNTPTSTTPSSDSMSFQNPSSGDECYNADGTPNLTVDVTTTQAGIPSFLSFSPLETVHGHAVVQMQSLLSALPTMPLAVPDVNPKNVAITFVDNSTGAALSGCANSCVFQLAGPTASGNINDWGGTAAIPVPAANTNIGIRVAIGSPPATGPMTCAGVNTAPTYTCYDYSNGGQPSTRGIVVLRSFDSTGSVGAVGSAPILRAVTPSTVSCRPYFSTIGGTCLAAGVTANIDFPTGATQASEQVTGSIGSTSITLQHTTGNTWVSSGVSLPVGGGASDVTLSWQYSFPKGGKGGGTQTAKGNFNSGNAVQQIFSGSDGTDPTQPGGPIMAASVTDTGGTPEYSLPAGGTATVAVAIGLTGGVHLVDRSSCTSPGSGASYSCAGDRPVLLRAASQAGSHTFAVDCGILPGHTGGTLEQEIQYGCLNSFSINHADVCPDPANPTPTDCAPVVTGAVVGQVQQAMNARFAPGGTCLRNNYPVAADTDPRVVTVIDTDFSAFLGNGGSSGSNVPVVTLASFYITGWNGAPNSCTGVNEPAPTSNGNGNAANIWGHFVKFSSNGGIPSGQTCDPNSVVPCVPALVR